MGIGEERESVPRCGTPLGPEQTRSKLTAMLNSRLYRVVCFATLVAAIWWTNLLVIGQPTTLPAIKPYAAKAIPIRLGVPIGWHIEDQQPKSGGFVQSFAVSAPDGFVSPGTEKLHVPPCLTV